jgi:hypothetical protein
LQADYYLGTPKSPTFQCVDSVPFSRGHGL